MARTKAFLYRELGDTYLASVMARECLTEAKTNGDRASQVGVLNTLANIKYDEGEFAEAHDFYSQAMEILSDLEGYREMEVRILTNLGGCLVSLRRDREGLAVLREAHTKARRCHTAYGAASSHAVLIPHLIPRLQGSPLPKESGIKASRTSRNSPTEPS